MARPRHTAVVPRVWRSVEPAEEIRAASFVMDHVAKMRAKRNVHKTLMSVCRVSRGGRTAFQFERIAQLQKRLRLLTNPIRHV